ncbi:hypothetical protein BJY04DRAFT_176865 [Aspergillus karnatakaensis]|uniref:uncharacterized protein n=1 Tax=Aspergillus karnatakaensis TaxID=1810916 RepID=UPI003CCDA1DA
MTGQAYQGFRRPARRVVVASIYGHWHRSTRSGSSRCGSQPPCRFYCQGQLGNREGEDREAEGEASQMSRRRTWGNAGPGPTQSQLLRFALAKDTHQLHAHGGPVSLNLREIFLGEWPVTPLWALSYGNDHFVIPEARHKALSRITSIEDMERYIWLRMLSHRDNCSIFHPTEHLLISEAFRKCEEQNTRADILAFINGIAVKLKNFESSDRDFIHYLGMFYAVNVSSSPALEYHLRGFSGEKPLGVAKSNSIVRELLRSLHSLSFEESARDARKLLRLINGRAGSDDAPSLHKVLCWSQRSLGAETRPTTPEYLSLLVHARADTLRQGMWDDLISYLVGQTGLLDRRLFHATYLYAGTLINAGQPAEALSVLKVLSKALGDKLPYLSRFKQLDIFLQDDKICGELPYLAGENEYMKILSSHLHSIERRLGLEWQPVQELHSAMSSQSVIASGQPLFTMDGASTGYEGPERLVEEVRTHGCSKLSADISKIVNLLDEYEGELIPVSVDVSLDTEFYWAPQRSPVKLRARSSSPAKTDVKRNEVLADLGLVKVTTSRDEGLVASECSLHLIQLGYLLQKESRALGSDTKELAGLKELGYMVTWDRVHGRFLLVYAGTVRGPVDPTIRLDRSFVPPGLRAIMRVKCLQHQIVGPHVRVPFYSLELDPSPNVMYDMRQAGTDEGSRRSDTLIETV